MYREIPPEIAEALSWPAIKRFGTLGGAKFTSYESSMWPAGLCFRYVYLALSRETYFSTDRCTVCQCRRWQKIFPSCGANINSSCLTTRDGKISENHNKKTANRGLLQNGKIYRQKDIQLMTRVSISKSKVYRRPSTPWSKYMAQSPKGRSIHGLYKPIQGNCAIYFYLGVIFLCKLINDYRWIPTTLHDFGRWLWFIPMTFWILLERCWQYKYRKNMCNMIIYNIDLFVYYMFIQCLYL